ERGQGGGRPAARRPFPLGRSPGGAEAGAARPRIGRLEQPPVPPGEPPPPLRPRGSPRRAVEELGLDVIRRHLGERLAVPAEQDLALPPGGHPGDALERLPPGGPARPAGEVPRRPPPPPAPPRPGPPPAGPAPRRLGVAPPL